MIRGQERRPLNKKVGTVWRERMISLTSWTSNWKETSMVMIRSCLRPPSQRKSSDLVKRRSTKARKSILLKVKITCLLPRTETQGSLMKTNKNPPHNWASIQRTMTVGANILRKKTTTFYKPSKIKSSL